MARNVRPIRQPKRGRKRRGRHTGVRVQNIIVFVLAAGVIILAMSLFFRVSRVEVAGMEVCGQQEIKAASGIDEGDFLFLVNGVSAERGIKKSLHYIESVSIKRVLPGTVIITVTETAPAVRILDERGDGWLVSNGGKLLEKEDGEQSGLPTVSGVTLIAAIEGTNIAFPFEQDYKTQILIDVIEAVTGAELLGGIDGFDLGDAANIRFGYLGRFTVNLGVPNDLEQKLKYIPYTLEKTLPNERGVIDLSGISGDPSKKPNEARFIPE